MELLQPVEMRLLLVRSSDLKKKGTAQPPRDDENPNHDLSAGDIK